MNLLEWLKSKVGKNIAVSHPTKGVGTLKVKNPSHAEHLHACAHDHTLTYVDTDADEFIADSMLNTLLIDSFITDNNYTPDVVSTPSFDGFGGGSTDGGGAGGSWEDTSSSSASDSFSSDSFSSSSDD